MKLRKDIRNFVFLSPVISCSPSVNDTGNKLSPVSLLPAINYCRCNCQRLFSSGIFIYSITPAINLTTISTKVVMLHFVLCTVVLYTCLSGCKSPGLVVGLLPETKNLKIWQILKAPGSLSTGY